MRVRPVRAWKPVAAAAGLALAALVAAGCATTEPAASAAGPSQGAASTEASSPPDPFYGAQRPLGASYFGTGEAILDQAVDFIATGTPSSLARGIRLASTADATGAPGAAAASVAGAALLRGLYPGAPGAGNGSGIPLASVRLTSPFLVGLAPSLGLLDPGAVMDGAAAAARLKELAAADRLQPGSPLPPFFTSLAQERRSASLKDIRAGFETALKRSPTFWPAAAELSRAIIAAGAAAEELPLLQRLASLLPTAGDRFEALARAEIAAGQPALASDAAAQGLLQTPDDPESAPRRAVFALLRAQALEQTGDWYQALWVLDALLRLQPDMAEATLAKARLLHEKGQNDPDALAAIADGETRHPQDAAFPELEGMILLDQHKPDEAAAALKKSHDLDPRNTRVLTLLATTSAQAGAWADASAWLAQIPDASWGPDHLELAWRISTGQGDHARALLIAQRLFRVTGDPHAQALQVRSLIAADRPRDALVIIDHLLLAAAPAPELASELHYLRSTAGSEDPIRDLRSALVENPDNTEALAAIADSLAAQKDYRKAMEYARRAAALSPADAALAQKAADLQKLAAPEPAASE
jgi:tetratricopeptide (TPR) repeat protein